MASWMRVRLRMSHGDASQLLKMSRLARSLPLTAAAWEQGRLSSGQVRVVVANVKARTGALFLGDDGQLVPGSAEADTTQTVTVLRPGSDRAHPSSRRPATPQTSPTEAPVAR